MVRTFSADLFTVIGWTCEDKKHNDSTNSRTLWSSIKHFGEFLKSFPRILNGEERNTFHLFNLYNTSSIWGEMYYIVVRDGCVTYPKVSFVHLFNLRWNVLHFGGCRSWWLCHFSEGVVRDGCLTRTCSEDQEVRVWVLSYVLSLQRVWQIWKETIATSSCLGWLVKVLLSLCILTCVSPRTQDWHITNSKCDTRPTNNDTCVWTQVCLSRLDSFKRTWAYFEELRLKDCFKEIGGHTSWRSLAPGTQSLPR
jgi:hypothetical protein